MTGNNFFIYSRYIFGDIALKSEHKIVKINQELSGELLVVI